MLLFLQKIKTQSSHQLSMVSLSPFQTQLIIKHNKNTLVGGPVSQRSPARTATAGKSLNHGSTWELGPFLPWAVQLSLLKIFRDKVLLGLGPKLFTWLFSSLSHQPTPLPPNPTTVLTMGQSLCKMFQEQFILDLGPKLLRVASRSQEIVGLVSKKNQTLLVSCSLNWVLDNYELPNLI